MELEEVKPVVEALLFAADHPLTLDRIRGILGEVRPKVIQEAIAQLGIEYEREGRSFRIRKVAQGYQIYTLPEYAPFIHELYRGRRPPKLSQPALETLAIIAYRQPIVRAEIETIRGVNVEGVLSTLLERNFITVAGRDERPGRPLLYETTKEFLRYFCFNDLSELPKIGGLEKILQDEGEKKYSGEGGDENLS